MSGRDRATAELRVPGNAWAEFVIYVPDLVAEYEQQFLIVPRSRLSEITSQPLQQLKDYADSWHLLRRRSEAKETQLFSVMEPSIAESNDHSTEMAGTNA
jgi:hypothetical protein